MILRMIVGPASRNQVRVERIVYPTAALLRSLQWVSDRYVSHRDTALIGGCYGGLRDTALIGGLLWWVAGHGADLGAAMGGCVATARRHSLLCLLHLLVNTA